MDKFHVEEVVLVAAYDKQTGSFAGYKLHTKERKDFEKNMGVDFAPELFANSRTKSDKYTYKTSKSLADLIVYTKPLVTKVEVLFLRCEELPPLVLPDHPNAKVVDDLYRRMSSYDRQVFGDSNYLVFGDAETGRPFETELPVILSRIIRDEKTGQAVKTNTATGTAYNDAVINTKDPEVPSFFAKKTGVGSAMDYESLIRVVSYKYAHDAYQIDWEAEGYKSPVVSVENETVKINGFTLRTYSSTLSALNRGDFLTKILNAEKKSRFFTA